MGRALALVFNPVAGAAGGEPAAALRDRLSDRYDVTIHETSRAHDAGACARDAIAAGAAIVVAAGGDGTVSAVADALVGGPIPLGVIPRGSANSIAAALGIPGDDAGACEVLVTRPPRALDTAACAGRTMVLYSTAGLHAEAIAGTSREAKRRWGALAYVGTALRTLAELAPFEVELETEAHVVRCRAVAVTVANLAPAHSVVAQGPSEIAGDDGRLDVTIVAAGGVGEAIATGVHLLRTAVQHAPASRTNVGFLTCARVRLSTSPPQPLLVDGEPLGATPSVEIACRPHSLRVIAPPPVHRRRGPEARLAGLPGLEVRARRTPP